MMLAQDKIKRFEELYIKAKEEEKKKITLAQKEFFVKREL
jgi:hypothetical protein